MPPLVAKVNYMFNYDLIHTLNYNLIHIIYDVISNLFCHINIYLLRHLFCVTLDLMTHINGLPFYIF